MLIARDALRGLHQQRPEALVLEHVVVAGGHSDRRPIDVELPNDGAAPLEFRLSVGRPPSAPPQPEQPHQNVLLRVLIRQEGLPPAVGSVVPPNQLHRVRPHLMVKVLNAALARADVATLQPQLSHASQRELAQVAFLHTAAHQWHWDVALDAIYAHPRRHQRQHPSDEVDELLRRVVFVEPLLPQLVESGAADDEGRVELEPIRAEVGVFEKLAEALHVPLPSHVGQVGHHVDHQLEPSIFRQLKAALGRLNRVPSIGVACHVLVDTLQAQLQTCAPV
mmetsp:Transcript_36784/g.65867  ORF Transcript_36784/g.65867 Transcript_36784/m.65867 type:complete len:279 (-) Transcript_36784:670-1506(-)